MEVNKLSNYIGFGDDEKKAEQYVRRLDADVKKLFLAMRNRLRFGDGSDGEDGENISGQFQSFTTSATPDAENTTAHDLGSIPIGFIVLHQDKAGSLYQGPTTGTNWTSTNIYTKCDVASVTFLIFVIK